MRAKQLSDEWLTEQTKSHKWPVVAVFTAQPKLEHRPPSHYLLTGARGNKSIFAAAGITNTTNDDHSQKASSVLFVIRFCFVIFLVVSL